ncbi:MAG: hypothetical protein JW940_23435 [Polyangiaceae bacterium]|nr:hypothetical protein [Polyangiaceae bacterium]
MDRLISRGLALKLVLSFLVWLAEASASADEAKPTCIASDLAVDPVSTPEILARACGVSVDQLKLCHGQRLDGRVIDDTSVAELRRGACDGLLDGASAAERKNYLRLYSAHGSPVAPSPEPAAPPAAPLPPSESKTGAEAFPAIVPTLVASGVAKFLVKRGEAEISAFTVERLFSKVCEQTLSPPLGQKSSYAELFPKTCSLIGHKERGATEAVSRITGLGTLRRAVQEDLDALPAALLTSVQQDNPGLCPLDLGYALVRGFRDGQDLWLLLSSVDDQTSEPLLRSYAVAPQPCARAWQRFTSLADLLSTLSTLPAATTEPTNTIVTALQDRLEHQMDLVRGDLQRIQSELDQLQKPAVSHTPPGRHSERSAPAGAGSDAESKKLQRLQRKLEGIQRRLQRTQQLLEHIETDRDEATRLVALARSVWRSAQTIRDQGLSAESAGRLLRTSSALVSRSYCWGNPECSTQTPALVTDTTAIVDALLQRDYANAFGSLLGSAELRGQLDAASPRLAGTVAALGDIAAADSSDGVVDALERYASPVGSWRDKYETDGGLALTGLAGMLGAFEIPTQSEFERGTSLAPLLAVGPELYVSGKVFRLSLFASIVDVGAITTVKVSKDDHSDELLDTETIPDPELVQLFVPGLYATVSLGKSPFVLGGGCSYVPQLRRAQSPGPTDPATSDVLRCGAALAVDIHLMPLLAF